MSETAVRAERISFPVFLGDTSARAEAFSKSTLVKAESGFTRTESTSYIELAPAGSENFARAESMTKTN